MAERRDRDARTERSDAALVAQYLHELSERHGGADDADAPDAAGDGLEAPLRP